MSAELTPKNEILSEVIWEKATGITKGGAIRAADDILEHFILVPRSELPRVVTSDGGNGLTTALAQERYQPTLRLSGAENDGTWSRQIAYANLAIAEAIAVRESASLTRREELARELSPLLDVTFGELSPAAQNAIDRIIELERKAS